MTSKSREQTDWYSVFDPNASELQKQQFTDFTLWKKFAKQRAEIEEQFSKRLKKWVKETNETIHCLTSYRPPALRQSLADELDITLARAKTASKIASTYAEFSDTLGRVAVGVEGQDDSSMFQKLMPEYTHLVKIHTKKEEDLAAAKRKYALTCGKYESLEKVYNNKEMDEEKLQEFEKRLRHLHIQMDAALDTYKSLITEEHAARKRLIKKSSDMKDIWEMEESAKINTLITNWVKCLNQLPNEREQPRDKHSAETISVRDIVNEMAKRRLKQMPPTSGEAYKLNHSLVKTMIQKNREIFEADCSAADCALSQSTSEQRHKKPFLDAYMTPVQEIYITNCSNGDEDDSSIEETVVRSTKKTAWGATISRRLFGDGDEADQAPVVAGKQQPMSTDVTKLKNVHVIATAFYKKLNKKELSLKPGMKILQLLPANAAGMAYGVVCRHNLLKKKKGYFPAVSVELDM